MTQKKKRLLIEVVIGLALLGLTGYEYGYKALRENFSDAKETRSVKTRTLDKYTSLLGQKSGLEKELTGLKEELKKEEAKLMEWQGPALAAANLQNTIKDIVTSNGGNITTERVNKAEEKGNYKIVSVGMDVLVPDTSALTSILFGIETRSSYYRISSLDIRVNDLKSPRELTVRLDVSALMKGK